MTSAPTLAVCSPSPETSAAKPWFSIIVPCCNEAESLSKLTSRLSVVLNELGLDYRVELVFVDDGSTDETYRQLKKTYTGCDHVRLIRHEANRGLAAAIASGLAAARGEIAATIDADCTYDPTLLVQMLPALADDIDMVVASPYHPDGSVEGIAAWRLALSKTASRLYRLLLRNKLHTYTSCFRIYRRTAVVDLPVRSTGFVGVVELLWQLDAAAGKIAEFPARLTVRRTGQSKMRVARTTLAHLRLLARIALANLRPRRAAENARSSPTLVTVD